MNRASLLFTLVIIATVMFGCKAGKFSPPAMPSFAMFKDGPPRLFKKKTTEPGPPSKHFDPGPDQMAANDSKKKPTEIPGESSADKKLPSQKDHPSEPMAMSKNSASDSHSKTASKDDAKGKPFKLPDVDPHFQAPRIAENQPADSPLRKPYEYNAANSLENAASKLTNDINRSVASKSDAFNQAVDKSAKAVDQKIQAFDSKANAIAGSVADSVAGAANNAADMLAPRGKTTPDFNSSNAFSPPVASAPPASKSFGTPSSPLDQSPSWAKNDFAANPANPSANLNNNAFASTPNPKSTSSPLTANNGPLLTNSNSAPDANKYPQTPYNSFGKAPNAIAITQSPATATPINPNWSTKGDGIATADNGSGPSSNRAASYTAELPPELLQGAGSYAPGSVRKLQPVSNSWR